MNNVLQAVLDYAKAPRTDYALLITGAWGCGKTYFWKHVAVSGLQSLPEPQRPKRVLYASMYGVSDVKDIDRALFAQSYPGIGSKSVGRVSRVISGVVESLGFVDLAKIDLRSLVLAKNALICFDDLERAKLPMTEVLGYINGFVEHEGAKAVILCNDRKISEEHDRTTYKRTKEKVVGACLTFHPDLDAVFRSIVDEYQAQCPFYSFVQMHAAQIRHLFDRSKTHNIRALRRAMSALAAAHDALVAGGVDPNAVAKQLIYAVAPAAFELHGRGVDPNKVKAILATDYMFFTGLTGSSKKKTEQEIYEEKFAKRYLRGDFKLADWRDVVGCPPVGEFLVTGFLDKTAIIGWARKLISPPDPKETRIKRLRYDWRQMGDEEFTQIVSQVLDDVEAGQLAVPTDYVDLYDTFESIEREGLLSISSKEILAKFATGLSKAAETGKLQRTRFLQHDIAGPMRPPHSDEGRQLRQYVLNAVNDTMNRKARERVRALAQQMDTDPEGAIDALAERQEAGLLNTPVFQELGTEKVVRWLIALPNDLKVHFLRAMEVRYERHVHVNDFAVELPALTKIRDALQAHYDGTLVTGRPVPMSLYVIRGLVQAFDRAIKQLTEPAPQGIPLGTEPAGVESDEEGLIPDQGEESAAD